jgi:surfeit locus 1 family protein
MPPQSRTKLLWTLAAVAGVVATGYLGSWQLDRAAYKLELQRRLERAEADPALHLPAAPVRGEDVAYHRVEASGEFRPELTVFLDNKVRDGAVGYEVVTPVRLARSDLHVLVNRGWVKAPATRSELPQVGTPQGPIRVEGIALPPPTRYLELSDRTVAGRVWQNLNLERYGRTYRVALQPIVIQQRNELGDGLLRVWRRPDTGVDTHRAYALQWFAMSGAIAVVYLVLNVRRRKQARGAP